MTILRIVLGILLCGSQGFPLWKFLTKCGERLGQVILAGGDCRTDQGRIGTEFRQKGRVTALGRPSCLEGLFLLSVKKSWQGRATPVRTFSLEGWQRWWN